MKTMPTRELILAFVTWRMRLVPARPRRVSLWVAGVTPLALREAEPRLRPLLKKIEAGEDLTRHLSKAAQEKGLVLPGANPADRGRDIDPVLIRYGLHHFHVGIVSYDNPKGRSGPLIFADVWDEDFKIIALSNHDTFKQGSTEQLRFFGICQDYMARSVPPSRPFMAGLIMSSGHSLEATLFARQCEGQIERLDAQLDDAAFIDSLYNDQPILRDGNLIVRPSKVLLAWYFDDLKFGIINKRTNVFFCIYPFFTR